MVLAASTPAPFAPAAEAGDRPGSRRSLNLAGVAATGSSAGGGPAGGEPPAQQGGATSARSQRTSTPVAKPEPKPAPVVNPNIISFNAQVSLLTLSFAQCFRNSLSLLHRASGQ